MNQPILETERLVLRPFRLDDAKDVQRLAGAPEVAATTLNVPHPYEDGMAEAWIGTHAQSFQEGRLAVFAITLKKCGTLVGCVGLSVTRQHERGEFGYWVGHPYWNNGYATEATRALLAYAFGPLGLNRIVAGHYSNNPSSGRVMVKLGMKKEGYFPQHILKEGRYFDLEYYGILKRDFNA
ncbi:MAG: GNAT family N-acetyltransferase [Planctomycetota bacterium]|nr:GNAT family N-acetyltransferase [Planctomycetota bacterium]